MKIIKNRLPKSRIFRLLLLVEKILELLKILNGVKKKMKILKEEKEILRTKL
jgi:hypothetical protein